MRRATEQREKHGSDRNISDVPAGMRLSRGFGCIRYLGEGRRNPYAVHPPAVRVEDGKRVWYKRAPAICYVPDWYTGLAVLTAWHASVNAVGASGQNGAEEQDWQRGWPAAAAKAGKAGSLPQSCRSLTVKEVYDRYYESRFGKSAARTLSPATAASTRSISKNLEPVFSRELTSLTVDELQELVNSVGEGRTSVQKTVQLLRGIYRYAMSRDLCRRNPAQYIQIPDTREHAHHQDFTDEELEILWKHREDPIVRMVLIMCYSGFRIGEYITLETRLEEGAFRGGSKTAAGKDRTVPIHSAIAGLVKETLEEDGCYLQGRSITAFCKQMAGKMKSIGIDRDERHHTPHSCRHTFCRLCESHGVREADRKRMMGHSFGSDITNGTYGHRTLEELREEIEKIPAPGKI